VTRQKNIIYKEETPNPSPKHLLFYEIQKARSDPIPAYASLFYLLNNDGALGHECSDGAYSGQGGQEECTDYPECERDLDQGLSFLVLDGDTADVPLTYQLLDCRKQLLTADRELLFSNLLLSLEM